MRIASGSALFVACLVVASSANGKSENTSVTLPSERDGRRVVSLRTHKKRGLYGDLSIDGSVENVQMRKVTPVLDRLSSRLESNGLEPTSDFPQELLEDFLDEPTGNLSTPPAPPPKQPRTPQVLDLSDGFAFPSDVCSLEPATDVLVYPPLYSGPPNTPLIGSAALFLSNPPLSRALAHCSTSLSIWCSENREAVHLVNPPTHAKPPITPHHGCILLEMPLPGEAPVSQIVDQAEGARERCRGTNDSTGTHIVDGGWVSNLVQTLSG